MGLGMKVKGKMKRGLAFLGVCEDDRLTTELPRMNQEQLEQQCKMASLRKGSAAAGLVLNSFSMVLYPAFFVGAALNARQLVVVNRTKKKIKEELRIAPVEHVKGTVRYFLIGAGMKVAVFVAFLGHVHAEDFVIGHLNPMDVLAHVPHGDVAASVLPVAELTHALQHNVHDVFAIPHAFNDNPVVAALQEIGNAPKEAFLGVGQELQGWGEIESLGQLAHQVAVGPAMEANVPAMAMEKAMEDAAEGWSARHRSARRGR
jgi:hypothetical protein